VSFLAGGAVNLASPAIKWGFSPLEWKILPRIHLGPLAISPHGVGIAVGFLVGAQLSDLGLSVDGDVGVQRIARRVILVIGLSLKEGLEQRDFGDDRCVEDLGLVQLVDIAVGDSPLLIIDGEDRRAVLPAGVGSLAVELRRVVRDGEKHLEDLAVAEPARVIEDLDSLGVVRGAGRDRLVVGGLG